MWHSCRGEFCWQQLETAGNKYMEKQDQKAHLNHQSQFGWLVNSTTTTLFYCYHFVKQFGPWLQEKRNKVG